MTARVRPLLLWTPRVPALLAPSQVLQAYGVNQIAYGSTPWHTFGAAPPAIARATKQVVPLPARMPGTVNPPLARRAGHAPTDDWATDGLILSDVSWVRDSASWPAG